MLYLMSFLEGIVTFLSPCLLPLLPLYLSYFSAGEAGRRRTMVNALGFVLGFSVVFMALGVFAGQIGGLLIRYRAALNVITGAVVVAFGFSCLGVLNLGRLFRGGRVEMDSDRLKSLGFASSVLFGVIFSVGWTPCLGAFLGSALMMAASIGHRTGGALMLLCYSLGLGVPFILSALLLDSVKAATGALRRHYRAFNAVCGGLLILVGVLMMLGWMDRLTGMLL